MLKRLFFVAASALLASSLAYGQGVNQNLGEMPGNTGAGGTVTTSGTIASTGTYQLALAANANRRGCVVQNQSSASHTMSISTAANGANPLIIASGAGGAGATFNCQAFVASIGDPLYITGTAGDAYVIWWQ